MGFGVERAVCKLDRVTTNLAPILVQCLDLPREVRIAKNTVCRGLHPPERRINEINRLLCLTILKPSVNNAISLLYEIVFGLDCVKGTGRVGNSIGVERCEGYYVLWWVSLVIYAEIVMDGLTLRRHSVAVNLFNCALNALWS
jgi:hypothetical protein